MLITLQREQAISTAPGNPSVFPSSFLHCLHLKSVILLFDELTDRRFKKLEILHHTMTAYTPLHMAQHRTDDLGTPELSIPLVVGGISLGIDRVKVDSVLLAPLVQKFLEDNIPPVVSSVPQLERLSRLGFLDLFHVNPGRLKVGSKPPVDRR